ncbi:S9 family peptidase [Cellulophaga baltica]|uniref:S9 family peptidase n=1 Tax=Cellulophaga TaxID=104264 RepID=UPI001C071B55|nr:MULTISPECIES: S9 family peptidase [Cellulophaga]MBU2995468.1 S9 family peptidase [Cellulophaga baltica]MDO6766862.1 S9 family peptidase [Cellulophaga sp. 1_MG-2023]
MKKIVLLFLFICSTNIVINAQKKQVTLEEIWKEGAFNTERLDVLRSLNNGTQYTVLNFDRNSRTTSVDTYDYETLNKVGTVVNSKDLSGIQFFTSYEFSADESKVLLATESEAIFRRSSVGIYYVYDVKSKSVVKISENKIQEPTLSPDNKKVAYVFENNIYILDLEKNTTTQITTDGVKNKIINGVTDWVYEEEFTFVRAFDWNSDGSKIAFLRFDETEVPEFSMDMYGTGLYQTQEVFKYPKAGENNAIVTLHMLDVKSKVISKIDINSPYYIPRIKWMNNKNMLSVQTINRHQDNLKLYAVNAKNNKVSLLLEEKDKAYVDVTDNLTFLENDSFIWTSEKDGYNHIYLYNEDGDLMNQITKGDWEVTSYYGYDQNEDKIYYQSTENGSINRAIYSISSGGDDKLLLTKKEGQNSADFSTNFTYFINTFSSATTPPEYTLHKALTGEKVKTILNNSVLTKKLESYDISPKEFSTIAINGNDLNMWMIKPSDFDASKKYPLFMFQYSGPGSQQVANKWMASNDYWYQMLASEGYIVVCVDGRGTGFKGRDFKKVTQKELGKYEVEDQIAVAEELSKLPFIDEDRTGIWGWSFGGFMSTNCILKGNDTFEMAIAVAPVTSWRFYDTIYTERYMQTPQENASGYDENSPFNYPELLKGRYLLVHGTGDDNVHVQNTMRMVEALVQANKPFDWALYPDKNHGIYGGNTRLHLYTKMTNFIKENL